MEERTIVIKIKNGESILVSTPILTADSRMFRMLINELKYDEIEMDDFSPEAVSLFFTILEDKQLGEIRDAMFRELHKLSVVFEVEWLKDDCRSWLRSKFNSAAEDQNETFLFDECSYILKKWEVRDLMNVLISCLILKDNSTFISDYMSDVNKLETEQIDIMMTLGGSNTDLFLRIIVHNLTGQRELNDKVIYLLQNMNLALCSERNEKLYLHVFDTISNLSEISVADMRFALKMMSETTISVTSRREIRKTKTAVACFEKKYLDLIRSSRTLNDITKAVSEDRVKSMFVVVELLLYVFYVNAPNRENTQIFVTTLENICSDKKLQKVSRQYLDIIIAALNYSNLEQSDQFITLLNEMKNNEKLSTYHENVIIKCDKVITVKNNKEYTLHLYSFKHPGTGICTESGKCGFILRASKRDGNSMRELCTDSKDYAHTGIHFHDIISAHEMFRFGIRSGKTAAGNKVTVASGWMWKEKWLPDITDWKFESLYIAYNVTDYLVAKCT